MPKGKHSVRKCGSSESAALGTSLLVALLLLLPAGGAAQSGSGGEVTFSRDIAPILQQSCQHCHHQGGVAPMSLVTYEEVRPWGPLIAYRTGLRDRAGAMPPWYVEKDIGIQHYKQDPSLSDAQIHAIARWVESGAPEGNRADLPPALAFDDSNLWRIGEPDLIIRTEEIFVAGDSPDWWGEIASIPIPLAEDRYVAAVEIREVNDVGTADSSGRETVGGRFVVHHMIWSTRVLAEGDEGGELGAGAVSWPVHEVGRNPDIFDPQAGRLLRAGSSLVSNSVHLHSNGRDTRARLEIGFKLHPVDYEPRYRPAVLGLGNGSDIDIRAMENGQELHAYAVLEQHTKIITFEPHLHAPGERMCLEAIWGFNVETLSCVGYDHNWVRGYAFEDDHQPILPRGTVLHIIGYMDNSASNPNVPDPRNWAGSGNRSVTNMFIDLGMRVALTEEDFFREMAERVERLGVTKNDHVIGCPLCNALLPTPAPIPIPEGGRTTPLQRTDQ